MAITEGPIHERSDVVVDSSILPPPAAPVVEVPVETQVVAPVASYGGEVRKAYASHFAPDAIIASLAGLVLLVVGLIAIVRGGFDGPMSDPVVQVLGFTHTTTLGLIEIVAGLALLLSGATRSRSGELFFASVIGIGAFVGAVQSQSFKHSLALESAMAWLVVVVAVVVVLAAMMMPRFNRQSTTIQRV
jgi:hypothetical protein